MNLFPHGLFFSGLVVFFCYHEKDLGQFLRMGRLADMARRKIQKSPLLPVHGNFFKGGRDETGNLAFCAADEDLPKGMHFFLVEQEWIDIRHRRFKSGDKCQGIPSAFGKEVKE